MEYVDEGMRVLVPRGDRKVPCEVVTCAMGVHARCQNLLLGIDTWFHVHDLEPTGITPAGKTEGTDP